MIKARTATFWGLKRNGQAPASASATPSWPRSSSSWRSTRPRQRDVLPGQYGRISGDPDLHGPGARIEHRRRFRRGLLDLGYAAFFAIGGYTAAFLTSPQSPLVGIFQTNFYVAMALSFVVAALCGVILGAPTLRLRGDYLAIVTLAFGEIVPARILEPRPVDQGIEGHASPSAGR